MPAATRVPGLRLAYDVASVTTTLVLPCTLTPWSSLWCVTAWVRLESVELKNRTPIEALSREVIVSRDTADEPSTVMPLGAGLRDLEVAEVEVVAGVDVHAVEVGLR